MYSLNDINKFMYDELWNNFKKRDGWVKTPPLFSTSVEGYSLENKEKDLYFTISEIDGEVSVKVLHRTDFGVKIKLLIAHKIDKVHADFSVFYNLSEGLAKHIRTYVSYSSDGVVSRGYLNSRVFDWGEIKEKALEVAEGL